MRFLLQRSALSLIYGMSIIGRTTLDKHLDRRLQDFDDGDDDNDTNDDPDSKLSSSVISFYH